MRHNCSPAGSESVVHLLPFLLFSSGSSPDFRSNFPPRQNPPITNVLPRATPPPPSPGTRVGFRAHPPSLTHAARGRRPLTPSLPPRRVPRGPLPPAVGREAQVPPSGPPPSPATAPAAATHVGVQAAAVAAAAAPAAAARNRNRRVRLSGRSHEPGRQQRCAMRAPGRGAPAVLPAAARGAGSRPAAQQRAAPAGGGGGGTGAAGPPCRPGEGGAAAAAPAPRSLFPRGCAGNLGPAWAPVPSSRAYAHSLDPALVVVPRSLPRPDTPTHGLPGVALLLLHGPLNRTFHTPAPPHGAPEGGCPWRLGPRKSQLSVQASREWNLRHGRNETHNVYSFYKLVSQRSVCARAGDREMAFKLT